MWRWLIGIFLILHGITHAFWPYFGPSRSWLIGDAPGLVVALWVAAAALFIVAGLALVAKWSCWQGLTIGSTIESTVLMLLFWSIGLWVGLAIDVLILGALVWMHQRMLSHRLAGT
jgi:hypothetical protein